MADTYVVEIYRRYPRDRRRLTGRVERIRDGRVESFENAEQLWMVLALVDGSRRRPVESSERRLSSTLKRKSP